MKICTFGRLIYAMQIPRVNTHKFLSKLWEIECGFVGNRHTISVTLPPPLRVDVILCFIIFLNLGFCYIAIYSL